MLSDKERDDMTYRLAICYLKTGNLKDAVIWLETLRDVSPRYEADCTYYLSYIQYINKQYEDALKGFRSLQNSPKYETLVPYYMSEILLQKKLYAQATNVVRTSLSRWPNEIHRSELYRILAFAEYEQGKYLEAMKNFQRYVEMSEESMWQREALYRYGLACYRCEVYTKVPEILEKVTEEPDALAQNAWYHIGLASLKLADRNSARMAFEQAAASNVDRTIKEQAAYNHALCVHETSYSAFGESVTVFEKFLNEFPQSRFADQASNYLVEVYMTTRSYEAALKSISRIAHPGPSILEAKQKILFQLGTQAFTNTQFEKAVDFFSQSLELGNYNLPTKVNACYWRGESYYRLNCMQEAARDFQNYLAWTPQDADEMNALAHYNLGYIAFHQKNYVVAQRHFKQYLQFQKANHVTLLADVCNRLGDCYLQNRHFEEARSFYKRAEDYHTPAGDYAYYQLALVAGLQKDYSGKVELLNQLSVKYPKSLYAVNALYEKGRSYVQSNRGNEAIATFRELLKKYPDSPLSRKAAAEIGLLYYQQDDYNRAIESYKYVITHYQGSAEARLAMRDLKSIYVDANRVDEFATWVNTLPGSVHFEPNEQDSLTYIAAERIYMKGQAETARRSFIRYLQSYPEGAFNLNARYYLSVLAKEQKNEEEVLEHTAKLLEYPDSPYAEEALLMHGEVLFNRQHYAEAMLDYQKLRAKATTVEHRQLGLIGALRCATLLNEYSEVIHVASALLTEVKLAPELRNEALYDRAKAYLHEQATQKALSDLEILAQDTRTVYGAEATYLLALQSYQSKDYVAAEKLILNFIDQSTPHAYWLARSFVLLSDVYQAMGKKLEARQYLLSLQQNYQADDEIAGMIEERLEKLNKTKE
ncbi:Tetratricopeptide repeat-containing protein [gut metagenome]|uniref:Tetratricopeptide repeat-containing protein n=1 Tax=gut metagenome TaxID=749906 RepID=J9FMZ9_9ZZZZ